MENVITPVSKNNGNENLEITKSEMHIIVEIVEYIPNSVVIKTILKKSTGNISVMSFDSGEGLTERTSPFDTFVQIIDGEAEIIINKTSHTLKTGESIVIPAHASNHVTPNGRFKMILTVIKSGYE
jgi:quercetin dioxygenase-like cupin family protein